MAENILVRYLKKLGLNDYSELSDLEKQTYKQWEAVLGKEVRIEDVAEFLEKNVKHLNVQLREAIKDGDDRLALILTAKIENYEAIVMLIKEPAERKKNLEKHILSLL